MGSVVGTDSVPPVGAPDRKPDFSFGWRKKMRETDEFSSVFRFRCSYRGVSLEMLAAPNGLDISRLGMIIPKKIVRTAVARNRIKRLLREWFRLRQAEISGIDLLARMRSNTGESDLASDFSAGLIRCKHCVSTRVSTST